MREQKRDASRSTEKDDVKGRDKDRGRDEERRMDRDGERREDKGMEKEKDRKRHHRSRHRDYSGERGERRERGRGGDDDYRRRRDRDFDRRRDYDKNRGDKHRHRSRSRSRGGFDEDCDDYRRSRDRDFDRRGDYDKNRGDRRRHRSRSRSRGGFDGERDDYRRSRDCDFDRRRDYDKNRGDRRRHRSRSRSRGGFDGDRDDYLRSRDRDFDRRRDYDKNRGDRHRHRSRSRSRVRSERRSRSPSKSKQVSGFDIAPPASGIVAGAAVTGQVSAPFPTFPGAGMFPLHTGQPSGGVSMMPNQAMTQQATRDAHRVYVGSIYPPASEQTVAKFFNHVMATVGGNTAGQGDAVVSVSINREKKFAVVEMRSVEEASNAMALDGIVFAGAPVRVKRPTDYNPSLAASLGQSQPNPNLDLAVVGLTPWAADALEGSHRLVVSGLPLSYSETKTKDFLLETLGKLESIDLLSDPYTGNSRGIANFTYQDLNVTHTAAPTFDGMEIKGTTLRVRRPAWDLDGV